MTHERDMERLLERWFSDGPSSAPDRVVDAVADRIDRQPQRPAWLLGITPVSPTTSRAVHILAAAAALLAVLIVGSLMAGGGLGPSPATTCTPSQTATPQVLLAPTDSLAAGVHVYAANGGRTTFTVPDGWSVPTRGELDFSLAPVGRPADEGVRVFYDIRVASKDDACAETPEPGIGSTTTEIIDDIAANPGVAAGASEPITIGALDGHAIDLALAAGWTRSCPFRGDLAAVPLVVDTLPGVGPFWGLSADERIRIIVLNAHQHGTSCSS